MAAASDAVRVRKAVGAGLASGVVGNPKTHIDPAVRGRVPGRTPALRVDDHAAAQPGGGVAADGARPECRDRRLAR